MSGVDNEKAVAEIVELLPPGRHPDTDRLERETVAWLDGLHLPDLPQTLRQRLRSYEFGTGVGRAFPSAGYAGAYWWSRFTVWYMLVEDAYSEATAARDLIGYLHRSCEFWRVTHDTLPPQTPDSPVAAVLAELLGELDLIVVDLVATRIRQALRDYLFATAWEAAARAAGQRPPWVVYRDLRRHFSLFVLNLEFVEHLPALLLTDHERRDPRIRRIRALACDFQNDVNELCSLPVEVATGNVFLPGAVHGTDTPDRHLHELATSCRDQVRTLLEAVESLAPGTKLHSYGVAVVQWAAGSTWWHHRGLQHRYRPS